MLGKLWGRTCGRSNQRREKRCCVLPLGRAISAFFDAERLKRTLHAEAKFRFGERANLERRFGLGLTP